MNRLLSRFVVIFVFCVLAHKRRYFTSLHIFTKIKEIKNYCTLVLTTLQLKYHIIQEMSRFNADNVQSILLLSSVLKVTTSIPEHLLLSSMVIICVFIIFLLYFIVIF